MITTFAENTVEEGEDMTEHSKIAKALFKEGYNCCQAVVLAFSDVTNVDKDLALKSSSSFGGGMGRLREVCGALTGTFVVAGVLFGYTNPKDNIGKAKHYDRFLEPGETISIEIPDRTVSLKSIPVNRYGFYAPAGRCNDIAEENSTGDIVKYTSKGYERVILVTWEYVSFISHVPITNDPLNFSLGTPDLMNKEAASRFIKVVHEKFYDELKDYFGTVIKGFFYDEPEVCFDFPWTQGFENEFIKRKGYDLRDNLPILMAYAGNFYHPGYHEADLIIKNLVFDYFDVWTDLVAENFYGEIQKYCHKRGVLSVGHQDMDNHTKTLASVSGHFFKNSYYNDSPGIDVIGSNIDIDTFFYLP
jgi:hypothetical protein